MSNEDRYCVDRIPPSELSGRPGGLLQAVPPGINVSSAILIINKMWPNGSSLRVKFMGGTADEHEKVKGWADQWTEHANLKFEYVNDDDAEIRVGFVKGDGSWSAVGTDALNRTYFPLGDRTMNFGWELEEGTVLHEFGHAIGLGHEHQNPDGGIEWNEQVVISALRRPPNSWSPETTRHNVLRKYLESQVNGTQFDPDSVMLYFFPASWTRNGVATHANEVLSATDKEFIGSAMAYPKEAKDGLVLEVNAPATAASIGQPGEEDQFRFTVGEEGFHTVETEGSTDVVMRLYGPNSDTLLVAEDDDSGKRFNAKISRELDPGEYLVQVRHYWNQTGTGGTGDYGVKVTR